jgi:DNA-binding PadR family transcriptional regulator
MVKDVRLSGPTLRVLKHFLDAPTKSWSGGEIRNAINIGAGTLYPLLARLEAAGWCESEWERVEPTQAGRPRRRFYKLTPGGRARARAAFAEFQPVAG